MAGKVSYPVDGGNIVRSWRQRMGWTQPRAAEKLGVHVHSEVIEAARLANAVTYRLMMERRAVQETPVAGTPAA